MKKHRMLLIIAAILMAGTINAEILNSSFEDGLDQMMADHWGKMFDSSNVYYQPSSSSYYAQPWYRCASLKGRKIYGMQQVLATVQDSYIFEFDLGYRNDTATGGDIPLHISIWDTVADLELAGQTITIADPGVAPGGLSDPGWGAWQAKTVVLNIDTSGVAEVALRFVNQYNDGDWKQTALIDNVVLTNEGPVPVRPDVPQNQISNVPVDMEPTLQWIAGNDPQVDTHVLYFGTDFNWVENALPTDPDAIVFSVNAEAYQHAHALEYETTYYWRVDEVSGDYNVAANVDAGSVWSFTTKPGPRPLCDGYRFDGDIDGDCYAGLSDLFLFAQDWLLTSIVSDADIDEDTNVDMIDFSYIGRDWLSEVKKPNMLFIHAHPDDEGIFGGGVLPYYAQAMDMQVTVLSTTTRNPDGSYPMSRNSADRMQMLRNAMDIYAGQSIGSGTFNELGHYITGNITHVESGLVATSCCNPDPLGTWSDADDGKAWGLASYVTELTPGYGNFESFSDGRLVGAWIIAREIRRFQPEVVVSVHDLEGEYGHENHTASAIGLIEAFDLAANSGEDIDGLEPWQALKLYIRGGVNDNRDSITWDAFASDGGINPLFHDYMEEPMINGESARMIADRGCDEHVSEGRPDVSTVFRSGERFDGHHSEWWTLYRSTVGPDTLTTFSVSGDTTGSTYSNWARGGLLENLWGSH